MNPMRRILGSFLGQHPVYEWLEKLGIRKGGGAKRIVRFRGGGGGNVP